MIPEQINYRDPFSSDTKKRRRALIASSWFAILLGFNVIKVEKLAFSAGQITPKDEKLLLLALGATIIYLLFIFLPSVFFDFFMWLLEKQRQKQVKWENIASELYPEEHKLDTMYDSDNNFRKRVALQSRTIRNLIFLKIVPKLVPIKVYFELIFPIVIALFGLYSIEFVRKVISLM